MHYPLSLYFLIYVINKPWKNHVFSPELQRGPGCPGMTIPQNYPAGPMRLFHHPLLQVV